VKNAHGVLNVRDKASFGLVSVAWDGAIGRPLGWVRGTELHAD
jgi:hypothetical protein